MYLSREQEKMLSGEYGLAVAKAMEIIVKVGESLGAEKLVPIMHAHVSGISYSNIGEPGLLFMRKFYELGARVRVYATVNPGCIDMVGSSKIINDSYRDKQLLINNFLEKMGFKPTYTCIPYYHRIPGLMEHLAWGESNAVIMANSFYGAMTNREGGPLALAAAITGYTYYSGLHIIDNRRVKIVIDLPENFPIEYSGALGLWIGYNVEGIPLIINLPRDLSSIKLLLAAAAASGSHGLIVLDKITPKNTYLVDESAERISVDVKDLDEYVGSMPSSGERVLGFIGCPHLHPSELFFLKEYLSRYEKPKNDNVLLIAIPLFYRKIYNDIINYLRRRGVDVAVGTCPIVSRLNKVFDRVVTNSGKAAFYLRRLHGLEVTLTSTKRVLEAVYG